MKYLSLFSGIGGFEKAIHNVYPNAECVGFSEIDKNASAIYKYHYPTHHNYGDATTINVSELSDFDFLVGGFPCQAFSIAGKRQGFEEARGTLFFEIARILQAKRPRYILLENVKGLVSHNDYETILTIHRVLTDLGYEGGWHVLNSKYFGVPQNRERVFFIYNLAGECAAEIFSIGEIFGRTDEGATETTVARCFTAGGHSGGMHSGMTLVAAQRGREEGQELEFSKGDYTNTLTSVQKDNYVVHNLQPRMGKGQGGKGHLQKSDGTTYCLDTGNGQAVEVKPTIIQYRGQSNEVREYTDTAPCVSSTYGMGGGNIPLVDWQVGEIRSDEGLRTFQDNISGTLRTTSDCGDKVVFNQSQIRRLTPVECERLQGFPDNHTKYGNFNGVMKEMSDSARYKACGNAVTVNVIEALIKIYPFYQLKQAA